MNNSLDTIINYFKIAKISMRRHLYTLGLLITVITTSSYFFFNNAKISNFAANEIEIIVWDFHDVIFDKKQSMTQAFWKHKKKYNLMKIGKTSKLAFKALKEMFLNQHIINPSEIMIAAKEDNLTDLIELLVKNEIDCTPNEETIALIKKLHELGYSQYLCSNISDMGLEALKKKYPEFFSIFKGTFSTSANSTRKPNIIFFEKFLKKYNLDASRILFIDDKKSNCLAAKKLNMQAFRFDPRNKKQSVQKIYDILKREYKTI